MAADPTKLQYYPAPEDLDQSILTKIPDGEGNTNLAYVTPEGHILPPFPGVDKVYLSRPKFREDDIWLIAYPKAGTHLTWEIIHMLSEKDASQHPLGKAIHFVEAVDCSVLDGLPAPRVLNTHYPIQLMDKKIFEKNKIVFAFRNPKDTLVSYYHHTVGYNMYDYHGTFSGFYAQFKEGKVGYGGYFDWMLDYWKVLKGRPNVLVVRYEDMVLDPVQGIRKIASFLGYDDNENFFRDVALKTSFKSMKQNTKMEEIGKANKSFKGNFTTIYRKGKVGDWKNHFTEEMNKEFEGIVNERMKDSGIEFVYEIPDE